MMYPFVHARLLCRIALVASLAACSFNQNLFAQGFPGYQWWNPAAVQFPVIDGKAWPDEPGGCYDRLPARAAATFPPDVWHFSHHTAGLYLRFCSNATDIVIRYVAGGPLAMPDMPVTGVSGIDLYALDANGKWVWAPGKHTFSDTIEYHFTGLLVNREFGDRDPEFRLFFPLCNSVRWMEIGVPAAARFAPLPRQPEKPIVLYGTSILQGACASRPGMAWTNLLQRALDRPVINLGFSGNGRLEPPVLRLMQETPAAAYVLDCLPNITAASGLATDTVRQRLIAAIALLHHAHPQVPVVLLAHSAAASGVADTALYGQATLVNRLQQQVYDSLQRAGHQQLYLLNNADIGLNITSTVDGVHPNDAGMQQYAAAVEQLLRQAMGQQQGGLATTVPVVQSRDGHYNWRNRHAAVLALNRQHPPKVVVLGNSILHYWGGLPADSIHRGADSWKQYLDPLEVHNLAFGWDKIENVLWRVYHDELDGYQAQQVVVAIGTNNLSSDTDTAIAAGLAHLVKAIRLHQPRARILLSAILPRRNLEPRIRLLNDRLQQVAKDAGARFINLGPLLLASSGKVEETLFIDGLHPNEAGYRKLGEALQECLKQ